MTVREVTSRVRGVLKEFYSDSVLNNSLIWSIVQSGLLMYLERDNKNIYKLDIFTKININKENYNIYEGTCVPLDCQGCRYKLPNGSENRNGLIYRYIASPDLNTRYKLVSPIVYENKSKLRGDKGNYMILEDGYLYTNNCLPCINIAYLADKPYADDECSVLDLDASIPDHVLDVILKMPLQELNIFIQKPLDITADKNPNK
jgi:hypothetical protein